MMTRIPKHAFTGGYGLGCSPNKPELLWVDVETTGLNHQKDVVLEVGFVLTDKWGDLCSDPFRYIVKDDSQKAWEARKGMIDLVRKMHSDSGLLTALDTEPSYGAAWIGNQVVDQLKVYGVADKTILLAGSTVEFDKGFIEQIMPSLTSVLHYRTVNVSSVKELCRKFNPRIYSQLDNATKPLKEHRVLPDIADSIKELQFYLDEFLIIPMEA